MKEAAVTCFVSLVCGVLVPGSGALSPIDFAVKVFAVSGEDVTLRVHPMTSIYRMTVEWSQVDGPRQSTVHVERNGKELLKEKAAEFLGRTALMKDGSLVLRNITRQDSGMYRCAIFGGSAAEVEMFFSLTVGLVPEVNISLRRTSANKIFLHWDSRDWSLKPQISLLDGRRKALPADMAQAEIFPGPDDLYSVRASVNTKAAKETGIIICRVEMPGSSVVKETQIFISDEFHPRDSSLTHVLVPVITFTLGLLLAVAFYFFGGMATIMKLQHLLRGWSLAVKSDSVVDEVTTVIDFNITNMDTTGTSRPLISYDTELRGIKASQELARRDLEGMLAYKDKIINAANMHSIHPAIIAAIISRQSQFGATLRPNGFGHTDSDCFGLMQINRHYHILEGGPYDEIHLKQGASIVHNCFETMKNKKPCLDQRTANERSVGLLHSR
ncbi:hypothetical protein Q5P01_002941 [Channa striata]|uniref:Ig-like domain-containing protein n=1 Tax=Channa striata TaxID=64152 RepID=A0AA88P1X6_CHASR|nr:hypothetical protein Q5P01_002941 [Channa striata]